MSPHVLKMRCYKEEAREGAGIEGQANLQLAFVQSATFVFRTAHEMNTIVYRPSLAHILGEVVLPQAIVEMQA